MKLLHLLLSLCLAFLLCAAPLIQAQTVPPIPTAAPTPPNGIGNGGGEGEVPPPPNVPTTVETPDIDTAYPNYAG
ncbi:PREDICTED: uncharacterized protein LOC108620898 [Drosophila arizonae]|uniref:Uncharacterized protein LOC108620898 n=1 Tax=Drosophila arizonae TaxID=7263 RepID=A0ABM1Q1R2_DROAR|nr:PREDICTED: uncharacterized protein LOC108620898 [Drosophila arizonae]